MWDLTTWREAQIPRKDYYGGSRTRLVTERNVTGMGVGLSVVGVIVDGVRERDEKNRGTVNVRKSCRLKSLHKPFFESLT